MKTLNMNKLELVDFLLMFTGKVNRNELMEIADISIATATRTLTQYRKEFPKNIEYNVGKKRYEASEQYQPVFEHDCYSALRAVAYGQRLEPTKLQATIGPKLTPNITANLDPLLVSVISRAIFFKKALRVSYVSSTKSDRNKERLIAPIAIFESRNNWYVRVCDVLDNSTYKNFKLVRFESAVCEDFPNVLPDDTEWSNLITLTIGPHIKHPNPEALKLDLGLTEKPVMNITVSEALAGFALTELGVDCSLGACLNPYHFQYCLLNRHELINIDSLILAPGFNEK
ncbi:WYL domain-containing protein [Thalassotalea sp. LPB0316]|uniref:WYL domain-containing protein n=1 Tax=Thalassotalea sp. LPB0316 TaxID=2769490 RepID=UPI0018684DC2|nr:WYL domain-containing protein [Thalassotalea sp. LPB0316]QOL25663.1 WYL domain-containing protein [Thalassotalea sp. LPB0316]